MRTDSGQRLEVLPEPPQRSTVCRGRLEELLPDGRLTVRIGNAVLPVSIATACSENALLAAIRARSEVLVLFLEDEPSKPVVVGLLRDRIAVTPAVADPARERYIDLEASEGIRLRAGESSIELRPDGRIEVRGVDVVSIAEGTNRIVGGSVAIN